MSTQVAKTPAALFVAAVLGVLVAVGVAVSALGPVPLTAYVLVVLGLLAAALKRARANQRQAAGRTCTCCTTTVFDAVEVK